MSSDFKKILVKDPRLMVTDQLAYAVKKGGQSIVSQVASAIAQSPTNINFNVQIPSEQTIVDRRVMVKSTMDIRFQTSVSCALIYGQNLSLAAFPFHQCASTIQATLNNNVTSMNVRDILPFLLRSNDCRELYKMNSSCPVLPDQYYSTNQSMGIFGQIGTASVTLRGTVGTEAGAFNITLPPTPNSNSAGWDTSNDTDFCSNGSFANAGPQNAAPTTAPQAGFDGAVSLYGSNDGGITWTLVVPNPLVRYINWRLIFTTIEPVLCQPFLFSDPLSNKQGIYGLQTIQLQYNLTDPTRAFRVVDVLYGSTPSNIVVTNCSINNVYNSSLIFKYITPHASDRLPARNVIPLLTYDRYFSNASNQQMLANYGNVTPITSNTYNLTQVPDKICIFLRRKPTTVAPASPTFNDTSCVIQGISINWNNNAGLLSSATLQDLHAYSVEAGSNQSFQAYCGNAYSSYGGTSGNSFLTPTAGSFLMLDFATVIQLTEEFYSCGSLGNFQLQFTLQVANQDGANIAAGGLELVLVVVNSGIMVTDRGQTSTYTGILTKSDVLDASEQEPLSISDVKRIVGSGHQDMGRALPMKVCDMLRHAKSLPAKAVEVAKEAVNKMANRLM